MEVKLIWSSARPFTRPGRTTCANLALNECPGGNHDLVVLRDGKCRLRVDRIARTRALGGDALLQRERNLGARRHGDETVLAEDQAASASPLRCVE